MTDQIVPTKKLIKSLNIGSTNDLKDYGLIYLTGEADPYSMRMLVDVTEQGKQILQQFLGVRDLLMDKNWNSSDGQQWSIMLPHGIVKDLMVFILFHVEQCDCVYPSTSGFCGYIGEEYIMQGSEEFRKELRWNPNRKKKVDNFNEHAFTGRTQLQPVY